MTPGISDPPELLKGCLENDVSALGWARLLRADALIRSLSDPRGNSGCDSLQMWTLSDPTSRADLIRSMSLEDDDGFSR